MCKKKGKAKVEPKKTKADLIREANKQAKADDLADGAKHWDKIRDHVMLGEVTISKDGKKAVEIVGFHSTRLLGDANCPIVLAGDEVIRLTGGCYRREISSRDGNATKPSTFFPNNWTEAEIKDIVVSAYARKVSEIGYGRNAKVSDFPVRFMGRTAFPGYE